MLLKLAAETLRVLTYTQLVTGSVPVCVCVSAERCASWQLFTFLLIVFCVSEDLPLSFLLNVWGRFQVLCWFFGPLLQEPTSACGLKLPLTLPSCLGVLSGFLLWGPPVLIFIHIVMLLLTYI